MTSVRAWLRNRLALAAAGLILVLGQASTAVAGPLTLYVTETGGPTTVIVDGGLLDLNPLAGEINVDLVALNSLLTNYKFTGLSSSSNSLTPGQTADLSLTGTVQLIAGANSIPITIMASDVNYLQPVGPLGILSSSGSVTFSNSPIGDSQGFQSWYNPNNTLGATQIASPNILLQSGKNPQPNSSSSTALDLGTPPVATNYGLTNQVTIQLSGGTLTSPSQSQFTGATSLQAVPEPAGVALSLIALPGIFFYVRHQRRRAS